MKDIDFADALVIIREQAEWYGVSPMSPMGRCREETAVLARHTAMYRIRQETDCTLAETGQMLGGRTPATISYGYAKIAKLLEVNLLEVNNDNKIVPNTAAGSTAKAGK